MTHQPKSAAFREAATEALQDMSLQQAMAKAQGGFVAKRAKARAALPEFDAIRDGARDLKNHVLDHLDAYLALFEERAVEAGAVVHWAETAEDAQRIVLEIAEAQAAKRGSKNAIVNKGKSMVSEEIGLNDALEAAGHTVVETDLGEYIIQLRGETPSHIVAPAVHVSREQVEKDFRTAHTHLERERVFPDARSLVREARGVLRQKYFEADVGVTGANMLVAETGQSVIVTNEGNGDLTQSLAKTHVVLASLEKIVPSLEDAATILRVLARSASGQAMSVYTTFSRGPRRAADPDGPEAMHIVLIDNGRTEMLGGDFAEMLRCIRCGACMNHCPVYQNVGGHAYGWVYPGPMGSVLTPSIIGIEEGKALPNASTFCGRCEAVCPVRIPLPKLMRKWREREFEKRLTAPSARWALSAWAYAAQRPALYRRLSTFGLWALRRYAMGRARLRSLPMGRGWTQHRDFPAPEGKTFQQLWRERQKARGQ